MGLDRWGLCEKNGSKTGMEMTKIVPKWSEMVLKRPKLASFRPTIAGSDRLRLAQTSHKLA